MSATAASLPLPDGAAAPAVAGDPQQVQQVLLCMDLVDRLRHDEATLAKLTGSDGSDAAVRKKIADVYAAQGITVTDDVIDRAIHAQRDSLFEHKPVAGAPVLLATLWCYRRATAYAVMAVLLTGGLAAAAYNKAFVAPVVNGMQARIAADNESIAGVEPAASRLAYKVAALEASLAVATSAAADAPKPDRIRLLVTQALQSARALLGQATSMIPATDALPRHMDAGVNDVGHAEAALNDAYARLGQATELLKTASFDIESVGTLVTASRALESAYAGVPDSTLDKVHQGLKQVYYTDGDTALRAGDGGGASVKADLIAQLPAEMTRISAMREQADVILADAMTSKPDAPATAALRSAYSMDLDALDHADESRAETSQRHLQALTSLVKARLVYRIPSRPRVKSGQIRYPNEDRSQENYYILVEPLDESGAPLSVEITSEEDHSVRDVTIFGVHVSKDVYEAVKADKKGNGIVDDADFGTKAPGTLTPTFKAGVIGGFITEW